MTETPEPTGPVRPSDLVKDDLPDSVPPGLDDLVEALKDVVDPELGVNIVDLGLVYGVERDDQSGAVTIDMTLTSPMCPLTEQLEYDVHLVLGELASSVTINWVWLPAWTLDNITEDGREQLRAIGYSL
ncbi:MAG: metal-sulfur cluster assembly factor [Propionibacteriaceae bacterium]|jgi:metal-sulfur cluster biosynthetic enzyme|nr:metal-sulfur cluster assembly factor [Propionibacteriaceae bacterium]